MRYAIFLLCVSLVFARLINIKTSKKQVTQANIFLCGMTQALRKNILDSHNEDRQKVASGSQADQPAASNMKVMRYSLELEGYASKWASTLPDDHNPNRQDKAGNDFGENIYWSWSSQKPSSLKPSLATDAVTAWFDEVSDFSSSSINPYEFGSSTGHYTQVVWADSYEVGCGIVVSKDTRSAYKSYPIKTTIICNYRIAGNMEGEGSSLYQEGDGCSSCQSSCNKKYNALCGNPKNNGVTADAGSCGPFKSSS